ncbi:MAG TPA: SMP-30/gluconolactonase/LRE family protein [Methylomirabilota bacterium]|nr:SMP-30/gluconolactonase/LRE family protein [Methylomirabilota bacterium]
MIAAGRAMVAGLLVLTATGGAVAGPRALDPTEGRPDAVVDLGTTEGTTLVRGQWRYRDARVIEVDFRGPGPDLRPSGPPVRTLDVTPHAGARDFDDSDWMAIDAPHIQDRRGNGRLALGWYRITVTVPDRIGAFDPRGATVVLEAVVDDYAEIWVDGRLPRRLGQVGGSVIGGFNAPNRVVIGRDVRPGQRIQLAVFGINGPLSDPPANFVWMRSATLDFYEAPRFPEVPAHVLRRDPAFDAIVPADLRVEKLAEGFQFVEGPVWVRDGGYLLFSDPNANTIYSWSPDAGLAVYRAKSGYAGFDIGEYGQPGSNGLSLDREGRLLINEHGNRRVTRLEKTGALTVLADRFEGRRLNSPNDLVVKSDGALYFTDPPFGLPRVHADPRKELPYSGIFRLAEDRLRLVSTDLAGPNGLAFSPDERYLYVTNWDERRKVVMRYGVTRDGGLADGRVFFDMGGAPGEEALDGMKVDTRGNLYVSGPGGIWLISAEGQHLGTIRLPELPANFAWGDEDGRTLYLTARGGLYRMRLNVPGIRP